MFIADRQQSKFLEEKADVGKAEFLIQYNLVKSSKFVDMCALIKNEEAWKALWINLSKGFSFFMVILGTICAYAGYSYLFQKPCIIATEFCLLILSLISKNKNLYKHAQAACRILIAILIFTVGFTYNIQITLFEELFLIAALFILLDVDDLIKKSGKAEFIVPALLFSAGFYLKSQHDLSNKYLNIIFCVLCLIIGIYLFLRKAINSNTHKKTNYNNNLTIKQLLACLNISIYTNDIEKNLIYASDYFGLKRSKILSTFIFIIALILAVYFNATFLLSIIASCLILFPKNKIFSSYFASIAYFFALLISIMDETNVLINFHNYSTQYHPNFIHQSYAYTLTIFLQCVIIYTILRTKMSPFEKKISIFISIALISLGYFKLGGLALTLIFGFLGIIVNSPKIVKTSCVLITMFILYGFMRSTKSWTYLWILFWSISLGLKLFNLYLRRISFKFKIKKPIKITYLKKIWNSKEIKFSSLKSKMNFNKKAFFTSINRFKKFNYVSLIKTHNNFLISSVIVLGLLVPFIQYKNIKNNGTTILLPVFVESHSNDFISEYLKLKYMNLLPADEIHNLEGKIVVKTDTHNRAIFAKPYNPLEKLKPHEYILNYKILNDGKEPKILYASNFIRGKKFAKIISYAEVKVIPNGTALLVDVK